MSRAVKSADLNHPPNLQYNNNLQIKLRRTSSASESTIASRSKIRPEPKFQKAVTSQIFSQMRRDSRTISRNPQRFLEGLVEGKTQPQSLNTESFTSFLNGFSKDSTSDAYKNSLQNLEQKCRMAKDRTLLLNIGSNPAITKMKSSHRSFPSFSRPSTSGSTASAKFFRGGGCGDTFEGRDITQILENHIGDGVEEILQSFLDELRVANVDNIVSWVGTRATLNDFDLPFGIPTTGLQIPIKELEQVRDPKLTEFIRSATEEFFMLDAEYHAKLEEMMGRILDNFRELEMADWPEKDSALLFHLMMLVQSDSMKGYFSREKLSTELATRIFPLYSREEIIEQKYRLKVKRALEEKRDSIVKDWVRDKENLKKKVNSAWNDIQRELKQKIDFSREKMEQQERCQYWTDLLEKMRLDNRKRIRKIETLVEPLEEEMKKKDRLQKNLERDRRLQQKHVVDRFRKMKLETLDMVRKREVELRQVEEKEKKIRAFHNGIRVDARRREFEMKKEAEKEMERKREQEKQARLEMLEKTKEKVKIDYHPANVLCDTHASLVRYHEVQQLLNMKEFGVGEGEEAAKFFRDRYSFSAETLWKDARVRLEAKLRDAGLIDNSYARNVLLAMQPQPKPHLKSQIKFDPDESS